ncbi:MAG: DUF2750 domain-containing protein [Pelistega sp.]|nr:DUF2750 domain-containing protein [Pelistega sp.]
MLKNTVDLQEKYQLFVKEAVKECFVYTLVGDGESALCTSQDFTDGNGDECPLICFWSSQPRALVCKKDEWSDFSLKTLSLAEFLENWCIGMSADLVVVGVNFDQNLFGREAAPLSLALDLLEEIKHQQKELHFKRYPDAEQFKAAVEILLNDD